MSATVVWRDALAAASLAIFALALGVHPSSTRKRFAISAYFAYARTALFC